MKGTTIKTEREAAVEMREMTRGERREERKWERRIRRTAIEIRGVARVRRRRAAGRERGRVSMMMIIKMIKGRRRRKERATRREGGRKRRTRPWRSNIIFSKLKEYTRIVFILWFLKSLKVILPSKPSLLTRGQ